MHVVCARPAAVANACVHFMRELTGAAGMATAIPGTKPRKFVAWPNATNLCCFVPGITVELPSASFSSRTGWCTPGFGQQRASSLTSLKTRPCSISPHSAATSARTWRQVRQLCPCVDNFVLVSTKARPFASATAHATKPHSYYTQCMLGLARANLRQLDVYRKITQRHH